MYMIRTTLIRAGPVCILLHKAEFARHVGAQVEATRKMGAVVKDSERAMTTMRKIVRDPKQFWRVQDAALETMPLIVNPRGAKSTSSKSLGGGAAATDRGAELESWYIDEFMRRFGVPSKEPKDFLPRPNNFADLLEYYIQRSFVRSIAFIR